MLAIFLILLASGTIIHRYLSAFWENKILPYSGGFTLFTLIFNVLVLFNLIWHFGLVIGIILFILSILGIFYGSVLWPYLALEHVSYTINKHPFMFGPPKPRKTIYALWPLVSFLLFVLSIFTVLNVDFKETFYEYTNTIENPINTTLIIGLLFIIGHILRVFVMKRLEDWASQPSSSDTVTILNGIPIYMAIACAIGFIRNITESGDFIKQLTIWLVYPILSLFLIFIIKKHFDSRSK